jgi:hypothetical protein
VTAVAFLLAAWPYVGTTAAGAAVRPLAARYTLHKLSMPSWAGSDLAYGFNNQGEAVGAGRTSGRVTAEIWRLSPVGAEVKRTDVTPPKGYAGDAFAAVNDRQVAVGSVVTRADASNDVRTYPAAFNGKTWTVFRSSKEASLQGTANAIATNGVVEADLYDKSIQTPAAAVITPLAKVGYGLPRFLPLPRNAIQSSGRAAFSTGAVSVVGGFEDVQATRSQIDELPVVWINGKGPYPINTSQLPANQPNFDVTAVFGSSPKDIYITGYGYATTSGVTGQMSFWAHIDASGVKPLIGKARAIPVHSGVPFAYVVSIGGGPGGVLGTFTLGGAIADYAGTYSAAVWTAHTVHHALSFDTFTIVNQPSSGIDCPTFQVMAIDAQGDGVGDGYCNGGLAPLTYFRSQG